MSMKRVITDVLSVGVVISYLELKHQETKEALMSVTLLNLIK